MKCPRCGIGPLPSPGADQCAACDAHGSDQRALSIRQPWADLIIFHGKDIENRTWRLPQAMVGRRVYIHAGRKHDPNWDKSEISDYFGGPIPRERHGAIIGEVTITGCVEDSESPWFGGPFGFTLADPVPLKPTPCKGRLGFFVPDLGAR